MSFNELGEMSRTKIVLGNFVNINKNPWLIVFGKCFSLVKTSSAFLTYSFDEFFISFDLLLIFLAVSKEIMISTMHQGNVVRKYIFENEQMME